MLEVRSPKSEAPDFKVHKGNKCLKISKKISDQFQNITLKPAGKLYRNNKYFLYNCAA